MDIERISDNKIKVTISVKDLEERNIDLNSIRYNSPAAQELFWDMMEQAEDRFGFNASDAQLCIEASSDDDEGFVVVITRVDMQDELSLTKRYDDESELAIQRYNRNKYKKPEPKTKKKNRRILSPVLIYSFDSTEDLIALSDKVRNLYVGESSLYKHEGVYYLVFIKNSWIVSNMRMFENMLNEHGTRVSNVSFCEGVLYEYGTQIADCNAIEVINNYF